MREVLFPPCPGLAAAWAWVGDDHVSLRTQTGLVSSIAFLTEMCFNKDLRGLAFLLLSSCSSDPIFSLHRVVAFPCFPGLSFLPMVTLHHKRVIS